MRRLSAAAWALACAAGLWGCAGLFHSSRTWSGVLLPAAGQAGTAAEKGGATSGGAGASTLGGCFLLALENNDQLALQGEQYVKAVLGKEKAVAPMLPAVTFKGKYFAQENAGTSTSIGNLYPDSRTDIWMELSQPLLGIVGSALSFVSAKAGALAGKFFLLHARNQVLLAVAEAYYGVLRAGQEAATIEASLAARRERLDDLKARLEVGLARETEVLLVETQIAGDEALLESTRSALAIRRAGLETLVGAPVALPLALPAGEPAPLPPLEKLVAHACASRQDLLAYAKEREAAAMKVKAAWWELVPDLAFSGNAYFLRSGLQKDVSWDVSFLLGFPVFAGGEKRAALAEALSAERSADHAWHAARAQVVLDVTTAWHEARAVDAVVAKLEKEVALAEKNYELLQAEYAQKVASNLELMYADTALQSARLRLEGEKLGRRVALLALEAAMGDDLMEEGN